MAEPFTLYKLIILYMLEKVDFPLTNSQISEFILDKGYTTYFKLQRAIAELNESGFIREESTHSRTFYHLTEEGAETIQYFRNKISPYILPSYGGWCRDNPLFHQRYLTCDPA